MYSGSCINCVHKILDLRSYGWLGVWWGGFATPPHRLSLFNCVTPISILKVRLYYDEELNLEGLNQQNCKVGH